MGAGDLSLSHLLIFTAYLLSSSVLNTGSIVLLNAKVWNLHFLHKRQSLVSTVALPFTSWVILNFLF